MEPRESQQHRRQVHSLLEASAALPAEEQAAFLDSACGDDAALRAEVEARLLGPSPSSDPLVGRRVTHYEVTERLGGGGMGVVYSARDVLLGRVVALKFLPPHLVADATAEARLVQEARAASALDHPNLGYVHEIGRADDGRLFIAMAYYTGETLKKKVERGPMPVEEAVGYAAQVAEGLARAHAAGIVHRDVKPANVMVTDDDVVKVVDFGLAKSGDDGLTQVGARVGTSAYMSPEQARGEVVGPATDVWALGVVLYEMLTGVRPFQGGYEAAVVYAVLHTEPPAPRTLRPALPPALEAVVLRCLHKTPVDRYASAAELAEDLRRLGSEPGPGRAILGGLRGRTAVGGRLRVLLLAVTAFAVLFAIGWFGSRGGVPEARHVAVLPFRVIGTTPDAEIFSAGLLETLTNRLAQLEAFQGALWVVPASEVRADMSADDAHERFGATLVISGSIQMGEGGRVRLTLNLVDALRHRQLRAEQIDHKRTTALALQDEAALVVARMLQVELNEGARAALTAGGTTEARANEFYLRAQGLRRNAASGEGLDEAIELLQQAVARDSLFALAYAGLGEMYWEKYRVTDDVRWVDDALRYSQHALRLNDRLAAVYVTIGVIHFGRGQSGEALTAFAQALAIDPLYAEAYRRRAHVYRRQGDLEAAEEDYRNALALKPDYWRGYNSLGVFYYLTGRYQEAVEQYRKALALAPANPSLLLNTGAAYWQMALIPDAVEMFERILREDPDHPAATSNLATAYFYLGRFEEAARLYEAELTVHPHDYEVQGFVGDAYAWIPGARPRAEAAYLQSIAMMREHLRVRPGDAALLTSIANKYARLGRRDSAFHYLNYITASKAPGDFEALLAFGVGETYEELGRREEALRWMTSALERDYGWMQVQYSPWLADLRNSPVIQALAARLHPDSS